MHGLKQEIKSICNDCFDIVFVDSSSAMVIIDISRCRSLILHCCTLLKENLSFSQEKGFYYILGTLLIQSALSTKLTTEPAVITEVALKDAAKSQLQPNFTG